MPIKISCEHRQTSLTASQSVASILFPERKAHSHSFPQRVEYSPSRVAVRLFTLFSILFEQLLPVVPLSVELAEAVVSNVCRLKLYICLNACFSREGIVIPDLVAKIDW